MGNSFVYVAFSLVTFVIVFSILFQFAPIILGAVDAALETVISTIPMPASWLTTYYENQALKQLLLPLLMSLGVVLLVLKVLMLAVNRGQD